MWHCSAPPFADATLTCKTAHQQDNSSNSELKRLASAAHGPDGAASQFRQSAAWQAFRQRMVNPADTGQPWFAGKRSIINAVKQAILRA
jgi:hypothetical protein